MRKFLKYFLFLVIFITICLSFIGSALFINLNFFYFEEIKTLYIYENFVFSFLIFLTLFLFLFFIIFFLFSKMKNFISKISDKKLKKSPILLFIIFIFVLFSFSYTIKHYSYHSYFEIYIGVKYNIKSNHFNEFYDIVYDRRKYMKEKNTTYQFNHYQIFIISFFWILFLYSLFHFSFHYKKNNNLLKFNTLLLLFSFLFINTSAIEKSRILENKRKYDKIEQFCGVGRK